MLPQRLPSCYLLPQEGGERNGARRAEETVGPAGYGQTGGGH
jgi:hypothetical protein